MGDRTDKLLHLYTNTTIILVRKGGRGRGEDPTLRSTQREKGRVMATMSQDMPNNSQPQTPIPPSEPGLSSGNMTRTESYQGSGSALT